MKNTIYHLKNCFWAVLLLLSAISCSDWLDVKPKTEEEASELFNTEDGFKAALAGIYIGLSQSELYGKELTFGTIGVLGQEWGSGDAFYSGSTYNYLRDYNYEKEGPKAIVEKIWNKMYEAIANVNTLIQYTELKKEVLQGDNYGVIRGEAFALRAFIHFDLLRMYAPHDFSDEAAVAIPYVLDPIPAIAPQLTPKKYMSLVLKDIDIALGLLQSDPLYTGKDVTGMDNGYLANRNFHLNYYAVLGLKARASMYLGDKGAALEAARMVIAAHEEGEMFPWVKPDDLTTTYVNLRDRTFSSEHLFAFNITHLEEYIKGSFREFTKPTILRILPDVLYEPDDFRKAIYETYSGAANVFSKFWQLDNVFVSGTGEVRPQRDRMPSLRLTEMYYIASECLEDSDIGEARKMLNSVREGRGLDPLNNLDKSALQRELEKEYYREFVGEGQLYFYYKRLGTVNIDNEHANAVYVFPMPDQEIDLGQRK